MGQNDFSPVNTCASHQGSSSQRSADKALELWEWAAMTVLSAPPRAGSSPQAVAGAGFGRVVHSASMAAAVSETAAR